MEKCNTKQQPWWSLPIALPTQKLEENRGVLQIFKMQHAYKLQARTNLQPFSHSNDDFYKIVKLMN